MNFFHQTFGLSKTIQVVRFQAIQTIRMPNTIHQLVRLQAIQTIRMPNTIHQLVRLQAIQAIQAIQAMYHTLVEREVFSVKSVLGINIFWVKKG